MDSKFIKWEVPLTHENSNALVLMVQTVVNVEKEDLHICVVSGSFSIEMITDDHCWYIG